MKKLKSKITSLVFIGLTFVFVASCNKDDNTETKNENQLTEEAYLQNLSNDQDAINYITASEEAEGIIRDAVARHNVSLEEFREYYSSNNLEKLNEIFAGTNFVAISDKAAAYAKIFLSKYPNLQSDLEGFGNLSQKDVIENPGSFAFLNSEIVDRGCRRWSRNWWLNKTCQGFCVGGAGACAAITATVGGVFCALGGWACTSGCNYYFCR